MSGRLTIVQETLGHSTITLTADLYTQFSESYDPVLRMTTTQELTFEVTP